MYHYSGFGLTIASELEFPELYPCSFSEAPAITIRYGTAPETLAGADVTGKVNLAISPTEYLLTLDNIATYYVRDGAEIVVSPAANSDMGSLRLFLLSNAMAAVLYQRDIIPLHAAAIIVNGKVVLFCGHSGSGKSTLVSRLQQSGYEIFTDDICALSLSEQGEVEIHASYPMIKLWEDSFDLLKIERQPADVKLRPALPKYGRFFYDHFTTEAKPVAQIFFLTPPESLSEPVLAEPVSFMQAFTGLQQNVYRPLQMDAAQKRKTSFTLLSKLAAAGPAYTIRRTINSNTSAETAQLIIDLLEKENH